MAVTGQGPRRDLFGDIAVAKQLLSWAQVRDALKRQTEYKQKGIPMRIGEICMELGLLNQGQINDVLAAQKEKRAATGNTMRKVTEDFDFQDVEDGETFKLGRYKLDKRLGGAMGIVYRGIDEQTGVTVALKVLPKHLAHDSSFIERFKREVKATCVLSHPNIVHIYDTGIEQGVFYLATEFIDGESLSQKLRREGKLSELACMYILRDVGRALAHAHQRNLLHRDVKPDNVMVSKDGVMKLADFGLAKFLRDEQPITADGIAVGTPHYISPEQARALKETDHRSDLYSLGASVFHLVTGRLPYEGDNGAEVMKRHVFEAVPDPRVLKPDLSSPTADMLLKLMAKSPSQRYQTADEMVKACEPIIQMLEQAIPPAADPMRKTTIRRPFAE